MSEQVEFTDGLPIQYCGLDPLSSSFLRLFIRDVLDMPELNPDSGIFQYRGHLVANVDIMGVVVKKDIREKVIVYSVDDGSGVIGCSCWKTGHTELNSLNQLSAEITDDRLRSKVIELQQLREYFDEGFPAGSLIRVHGNITIYNGWREIKAIEAVVINDPKVETSQMFNRLDLYQHYYDRPPSLPSEFALELGRGDGSPYRETELVSSLSESILNHVEKHELEVVHIDTLSVEPQLMHLASKSMDPEIWHRAMMELEVKGHLCCYDSSDVKFMVINHNSQLHADVLQIIRDSSGSEGCHFQCIFDVLCQSLRYAHLCKIALQHCLTTLEKQSKVTMVSEKCYAAVSY